MAELTAGVDVGGTFTDLVVRDRDGSLIASGKVPTTPEDQSIGILGGFRHLGVSPHDIGVLVHGTTTATNALIEGRGARAALLTTHGFTDVIELRNRHRPNMYGLTGTFTPLVPRNLRFPIRERMDARGRIVTPLSRDDLLAALDRAVKNDVTAIAIGFLHAYANPEHELEAAAVVREEHSGLLVCTSHEVSPEVREYERFSTLVANAVLMPLVSRYVSRLEDRLRESGFAGQLLIVQSNGGVTIAEEAARFPVNLVLSGPAAGVTAAQAVAVTSQSPQVIAMDIGGTSLDLSIIRDGAPRTRRETEIRYGVPIRLPMIDIVTAGAGGGSIAWLDERGILNVGPQSAGSVPGPACYGRGGQLPTVTDANVVLGRLADGSNLGGEVMLDRALAIEAIEEHIAKPLGIDVIDGARAILEILTDNIAGHIRRCTVDVGFDPREMTMVAFGGAGGLHAGEVLLRLELNSVIMPSLPGVFSAVGCTSSEYRHDYARTLFSPLEQTTVNLLDSVVSEHRALGEVLLEREGVAREDVRLEVNADMQYDGQTHTILVPLDHRELSKLAIQRNFEKEYVRRFGRTLTMDPTLVALRTSVVGRRPGAGDLPVAEAASQAAPSSPPHREIRTASGWVAAPVLQRDELPFGWSAIGPAIIEQGDTSVFVDPGLSVKVDGAGQLILRKAD